MPSLLARAFRRLLLTLCSVAGVAASVWFVGLLWFIQLIPNTQYAAEHQITQPVDAIVVLTGGSLRVEYGLSLLADGKGKKLLVSGVGKGVTREHLLALPENSVNAKKISDITRNIALGYEADSTIGNAEETAAWMRREGFRSLRLVTANYHMPRSLFEFTQTMPDITIIPDPVFPDQFRRDAWWQFPGTLKLLLSEYHKFMGRLLQYWAEQRQANTSAA